MIVGAVMADRWDDDVRLSDLEPRFTCTACGKREAEARAELLSVGLPLLKTAALGDRIGEVQRSKTEAEEAN